MPKDNYTATRNSGKGKKGFFDRLKIVASLTVLTFCDEMAPGYKGSGSSSFPPRNSITGKSSPASRLNSTIRQRTQAHSFLLICKSINHDTPARALHAPPYRYTFREEFAVESFMYGQTVRNFRAKR